MDLPSSTDLDPVEAQLQQELQILFDHDTQSALQTYAQIGQRLRPDTWSGDIQELYRCIHTLKGGAVTVGAEAILQVATALEDLLSDLRVLEQAPELGQEHLRSLLLEAGELLGGSVGLRGSRTQVKTRVGPLVERVREIQGQIRQSYIPQWNERLQLWHEFAEQGLDLVLLDVELGLEQISSQGALPADLVTTAKRALRHLLQIGVDLEFAAGWRQMLGRSRVLLSRPEVGFWRSHWPIYVRHLKDCARQGGRWPITPPTSTPDPSQIPAVTPSPAQDLPTDPQDPAPDLTQDPTQDPTPDPTPDLTQEIRLPIPLSRLDRFSQEIVQILLTMRGLQGIYDTLHSQLRPLLDLAQESAQYLTQLRQMQEDYAILNSLHDPIRSGAYGQLGIQPERYRQGYRTLNRLLENSLRLTELGGEANQTAQQTAQTIRALDRTIGSLQQTLESNRSVPFRLLTLRARSILRDLITRVGKPARLEIHGEQLELDAGTLHQLEPVLLHLLRNAYDHGLEDPDTRRSLGKPEQGQITLTLQRRGNRFWLEVRDDGTGIDPQQIQAQAELKGGSVPPISSFPDLLHVLSQPGFSSRHQISDLSGRGVGLDVVAHQIARMGGRLSLETQIGIGTAFQLEIPVPHLLVRAVLVQVGGITLAIPAEDIQRSALLSTLTHRLDPNQIGILHIQEDSLTLPALDLQTYWHGHAPDRRDRASTIALRLHPHGSQLPALWVIADQLKGQSDLLIQPLSSPLIAPLGLLGVSLQIDGQLIPVLDAVALQQIFSDPPTTPLTQPSTISTQPDPGLTDVSQPLILAVDDAALVRRRLEVSLRSHGYRVMLCQDGEEAWRWILSHNAPDLMITDIEMPQMDGFTLIERCRGQGFTFPILVISSRLSEEWGREAQRLGASGYLTKGFSTPQLIAQVADHLPTPMAHPKPQ